MLWNLSSFERGPLNFRPTGINSHSNSSNIRLPPFGSPVVKPCLTVFVLFRAYLNQDQQGENLYLERCISLL